MPLPLQCQLQLPRARSRLAWLWVTAALRHKHSCLALVVRLGWWLSLHSATFELELVSEQICSTTTVQDPRTTWVTAVCQCLDYQPDLEWRPSCQAKLERLVTRGLVLGQSQKSENYVPLLKCTMYHSMIMLLHWNTNIFFCTARLQWKIHRLGCLEPLASTSTVIQCHCECYPFFKLLSRSDL